MPSYFISCEISSSHGGEYDVFRDPWWWRQYIPLKRRSTIILHGSTTQKTALNIILYHVNISDLVYKDDSSVDSIQHDVGTHASIAVFLWTNIYFSSFQVSLQYDTWWDWGGCSNRIVTNSCRQFPSFNVLCCNMYVQLFTYLVLWIPNILNAISRYPLTLKTTGVCVVLYDSGQSFCSIFVAKLCCYVWFGPVFISNEK
jgi:hypothetical protein